MNNHITELKKEFFNSLFYKKEKKNDSYFVCKIESIERYYKKLYLKYQYKMSYFEFYSECMIITYKAIERFKIRDNGNWENIINGTDKVNLGKLIANIKTTLYFELINYVRNYSVFVTAEEAAYKKENVVISSSDIVLFDEKGALINNVNEKNNVFYVPSDREYKKNFFCNWFEENKKRILLKSQVDLLEKLVECNYGLAENKEVEKVVGIDYPKIKVALNRIRNRILKVWNEEKPMKDKTEMQIEREKEKEFLTQIITLINSDDYKNQNILISNWIIENIENKIITNIIDDLNIVETKELTKAIKNKLTLPSKVLYKVCNEIEEYFKLLNK